MKPLTEEEIVTRDHYGELMALAYPASVLAKCLIETQVELREAKIMTETLKKEVARLQVELANAGKNPFK